LTSFELRNEDKTRKEMKKASTLLVLCPESLYCSIIFLLNPFSILRSPGGGAVMIIEEYGVEMYDQT